MTCVTAYDSPELARKSFAGPSLGVGEVGDRVLGRKPWLQGVRVMLFDDTVASGRSRNPPPSFVFYHPDRIQFRELPSLTQSPDIPEGSRRGDRKIASLSRFVGILVIHALGTSCRFRFESRNDNSIAPLYAAPS